MTARDDAALRSLSEELCRSGAPDVVCHAADLADIDALAGAVDAHRSGFGNMDALVLSGGVGTAGTLDSVPARRVDQMFAVNVASAVAIVQRALPLLRDAAATDSERGSRVIALASITGVYAEPGLAAYGASKAALISLMETLNAEESGAGVMATAIAPAYVATDMSAWTIDTVPAPP